MALTTDSFKTIRSWNGSQNNAFEELCYQLRDPVTAGAELRKTGNPDRGYEWYELHSDGREWGWQAKYTFTIDEFLKLAEETLRTVVAERPNCERLTYCIPFDLPDVVPKKSGVRTGSSAWEKYEKWKEQRGTRVPGSESIEIQLWSAGDLLRRLNTPDNRGRAWFFWDENVLTLAWCREKLDIAKKVAGPRYTENLNVELPIADTLAGLARSEQFETGAARLCDAVVAAARSYFRTQDTSPDPDTAAITAVEAACAQLSGYAGSKFATVPKALHSVLSACFAALNPRLRTEDPSPAVWSITARLSELEKFITSEAAEAAESGTLLVSGQAGQGKTHLFIEVADGLVTAGHPAVVIMGGRLSGRNALGEIAETSIGSNNWDAMLGAMAAAGEAYGRPFVLLIDALNEADEPTRWREEFPAVVGEVGRYSPWVVIGASIRSTYLDVALPEVVPISPHVVHEGFAGREAAAVEAFFTHYGLGVPRTPPIGEAMSNPLFLTLYCKSRASGFLSASAAEKAHVSAVFDSFVSTVNKAVCKTLQLDPADRLVHSCVAYLASEFAGSGKEWVDRPSAKQYITSLAPHLTQWPKTLFEQLRSEGLIITDVARTGDRSVPVDVVRFAYQRFADYKIAEHLLEPISDGIALAAPGAEATRARIADASAGVIEALSVLVPEKFDVELLPAAPWELGDQHRVRWQRAFVDSLPNRGSSAITANTVALFEEIRATAAGLFARSAAALVELAVRPGHLLDVEYLHRDLAALAMPQRDATWGIAIYGGFQHGPLAALIRWAGLDDPAGHDVDAARRAAIVLAWTLSTPHRPTRDHVTKVLVKLLTPRLLVLEELLTRFAEIDDPYIFQRLCVITHGALIAADSDAADAAAQAVRTLAEHVRRRRPTPDLLVDDALRGSLETCERRGFIDAELTEALSVMPRTGLDLPSDTEEQIREAYGSDTGSAAPGYRTLLHSIFGLGDFGIKVVDSDVGTFSFHPIDEPYPTAVETASPLGVIDVSKIVELLSLDEAELEQMLAGTATGGDRVEDPVQESGVAGPTETGDNPDRFPAARARVWIFRRVIELGWTPDLFADFDATVPAVGREAHKPERFGKKYQWIALHELLARIADNYHMRPEWGEPPRRYLGPWQFHERDIDPTLQPAVVLPDPGTRASSAQFGPPFQAEPRDAWWVPPGPTYLLTDPIVPDDWVTCGDDVVEMEPLLRRFAQDGSEWIVLHSQDEWKEQNPDNFVTSRSRREQWSHIFGWLVQRRDTAKLVNHLGENSLFGRWMPEGRSSTSTVYLGEMPWAVSANEYPQQWERGETGRVAPCAVYPAWNEYVWESGTRDCSIDEAVHAWMPALELFQAGQLRWIPYTRRWSDSNNQVVAEYRETADHRALLVRSDWLIRVLAENSWSVVFGRLGEKQLIPADPARLELYGDWIEINTTAVLYGSGKRKICDTRIAIRSRPID